ncbi:Hypothetical protein FKW44_017705 [Caligus rogercresseyi]|uniref:Uncharacterized protein n=1 Tax=Caligus rogercresseyi TaxID=217165 RepID=A0A7T8GTB3_CALRO|nr:Hypothetical protein FKW44_017705 [Caligus rogercresseyi]
MWHGHIRAAARVERKKEREEEQKRQFKAWLKQGNSSTGKRGAPRKIQAPKQAKKYQEPWKNGKTFNCGPRLHCFGRSSSKN